MKCVSMLGIEKNMKEVDSGLGRELGPRISKKMCKRLGMDVNGGRERDES